MQEIQALAESLGFVGGHGYCETAIPEVQFFSGVHHEGRCPQKYDRGIIFILQGAKSGRIGNQEFVTNNERYLILTNSYPIECETFAKQSEPLMGIYIGLDIPELQRISDILLSGTGSSSPGSSNNNELFNTASASQSHSLMRGRDSIQSFVSCEMTSTVKESVTRLICALQDTVTSKVLGQSLLTQIYYDVMSSHGGCVLQTLATQDSRLAKISAAMEYIETHMTDKISIDELAMVAGMSLSSFHHQFKEMTGESPLQYLKKLRLLSARHLMVYGNKPANQAAYDVGYESPTQFSREFKRYFGVSPGKARTLPYSQLTGVKA